MKQIRFTTVLVLLMFCVIPIMSILMVHHLTLSDTLAKMGTGSFGDSYSYLSIDNPSEEANECLIDSLNQTKTKFAVCLDVGSVRYIYFNKKYANLPMESGRFFRSSDFAEENNVAVVGKDRKNELYVKDGRQYISVYEKEYLVLGVIGYQDQTVLDNYIFINMCSGIPPEISQISHVYLIDSFSGNAIEIAETCMDTLEEEGISSKLLTAGESYSNSIMPQLITSRWFIGLLLCSFVCLLLVSVQWVNYQKREICIRRLTGASIGDVMRLIVSKYASIAVIAFVVGFVYCNILYPAYFGFLLYGYAVCVVFIVFFLLWTLWIVLHEPVWEAIK